MTTKPPHGTAEWLALKGIDKLAGETDEQFFDRMRAVERQRTENSGGLVRHPVTGVLHAVMPAPPGGEHRPTGGALGRTRI